MEEEGRLISEEALTQLINHCKVESHNSTTSSFTFDGNDFVVSEDGDVSLSPGQRIWVGTQEEWDAIPEEEKNKKGLVCITNEPDDLKDRVLAIENKIPENASEENKLATMADISGGGQGGHDFNSDDFSIDQNEVSLLDGRRIVELTGAEYDALSQNEKMNGNAYFINDRNPSGGGGGGTGGASIVPLTDNEYSQDQEHIIFFNTIKDYDFIVLTMGLTDDTYYINEETLPAEQTWTFSFPVHGFSSPGVNNYVYRFSQPSVRSSTNPPAASEIHFLDFNLMYYKGIAEYGEFFDRNNVGGGTTEYHAHVNSIFGVKCSGSSGGSDGGSENITEYDLSTISLSSNHNVLDTGITDYDDLWGKLHCTIQNLSYVFPVPYKGIQDCLQVYVENGELVVNSNLASYKNPSGKLYIKNLVKQS